MTTYLCPMRLVYCALITLVFFVSCESARKDNSTKIALAARKIDSLSMLKRPCVCSDTIKASHLTPGVGFANAPQGAHHGASNNFERILTDDEILAKFSHDSIRLTIKSITFSHRDTIPEKFRIFENVEAIHTSATYGLDMFLKLKRVSFFMEDVKIDSTMKWPRRIESLSLEKCSVSGLTSFKAFHNLTYLDATYTFFNSPIKDIQSLSCLQILVFGAHMKGSMDLREIDVSEFKCLRKMVVHSWAKDVNISGIPNGIENNSNRTKFEISHPNLTAAEKVKLKAYGKSADTND